jgi:hypothetical protein
MDPNEIIKAAPKLLKHGAELVGALKLTEIAKAMLGPATGEFAERVRDEIRLAFIEACRPPKPKS